MGEEKGKPLFQERLMNPNLNKTLNYNIMILFNYIKREIEPQVDQRETAQSTAHAWELQGCDWLSEGQTAPPFCAATITVRLLV